LHTDLNWGVKNGTDAFKTVSPTGELMTMMFQYQNLLSPHVHSAGYAKWDNAFLHTLPLIVTESKVESITVKDGQKRKQTWVKAEGHDNWILVDKNTAIRCIWPEQNGLCARIAREALRMLYNAPISIEKLCQRKPLTHWLGYVKKPSQELYNIAMFLKSRWIEILSSTPTSDNEAVANAKKQFQHECEEVNQPGLAEALWWVSHSNRNDEATAGSVFAGFPDECKRILKDKPGLQHGFSTLVVGVQYQCPDLVDASLPVEIIKFTHTKMGKPTIRFAVVGELENQVQPQDMGMPRNMIGLIPLNGAVPQPGQYNAHISKTSAGAWEIVLG